MSELKAFIDELLVRYCSDAEAVPAGADADLSAVPQPLAEFYSLYDSVRFPFGSIDPPEIAVHHSAAAEPFRSEQAFCFGADANEFCFWLCALDGPDEDGCVFTSWDHELDDGIEYAFGSLTELPGYAEREYIEMNS
ncbi:MAG: hypothetical protein E7554_08310 [Ruminococcaceae bacterium]|nr:hypothetical protein [Oscillospiraceae bacterium]